MAEKDYYETLGVSKTATQDEVKKAFRRKAKEFHPDANATNKKEAEAKFKEINEAYSVLSNEDKRKQYDQFGSNFENMGAGFGGGGAGNYGGFNYSDFSNMGGFDIDLEDILGNMFGGGFSGSSARKDAPRQGSHLQYKIDITFEEAVFGATKEVTLKRNEKCSTCSGSGARPGTTSKTCSACNGKGKVQSVQRTIMGSFATTRTCDKCQGTGKTIESPCADCSGSGIAKKSKKMSFKIPAGIEQGQAIVISGEGDCGYKGGPNGDVILIVDIKPHKVFTRRNRDIVFEQEVSFVKAVMGGNIVIPTLEGNMEFNIPEGTQQGAKFTIKEKGVPVMRGNSRGNLEFTVKIDIPKKLNEKQKTLMRELADTFGEDVGKKKSGFFK
ncbi:MAG: molecular chaperone DnaJ [Clostridia bacterium]